MKVALYKVLAVTFSWRGVALIDGLGVATASGIGLGVAVAASAALGVATAMDAVGFDVIAGVETGVATWVGGAGVTNGSGPGPPERVTTTRPLPTTAPTPRLRFGLRAGRR